MEVFTMFIVRFYQVGQIYDIEIYHFAKTNEKQELRE